MAPRVPSYAAQEFRLIKESDYGVIDAGASWRKMNAMTLAVQPTIDTDPFAAAGDMVPSLVSINDDYLQGSFEGRPDYNTLQYILSSLFGAAGITTPGGATNAREWLWNWSGRGQVAPVSFAASVGTPELAELSKGIIFNGFSISGDREGMDLDGELWGKEFLTGYGLGGYHAPEQLITIKGTPTGGTFTLVVNGKETAGIAYNAATTAVADAINAVAPAGWTAAVAGSGALPGNTHTVTFTGGTGDIGVMLADASNLTGGGGDYNEVRIAVGASPVDSATDIVAQPIFPTDWAIYLNDSWATLGQRQLIHTYNMDLGFGEKYERTKPINRSKLSDSYVEIADQEHTLELNMAVDAVHREVLEEVRRGDKKFVRLEAEGPTIEAAIKYYFRIDMCLVVDDIGESEELNNIYARPVTWRIARDQVSGKAVSAMLRNSRASL